MGFVNNTLHVLACAVLSGVFTDVESSLKEIRDVLEADEGGERALQEAGGPAVAELHPAAQGQALAEIRRDLEKYMEAHEKASFTNTELHRAMNLHISNLRLLGGPLESLREALPRPQLSEGAENLKNEFSVLHPWIFFSLSKEMLRFLGTSKQDVHSQENVLKCVYIHI